MSRTVAILLTALTTVFCGLPGLCLMCVAALAEFGAQLPTYKPTSDTSPQDLLLGVLMFVCLGVAFLLIPIIVGFFSFRLSRSPDSTDSYSQPLPPSF